MKLRLPDIISIAVSIIVALVLILCLWMTWTAFREPMLRDTAPVLAFSTVLVFLGLCGSLWWTRNQLREWRWERAEREGRCGRCGYDVRATQDVCPECDMPVWRPPPPPFKSPEKQL